MRLEPLTYAHCVEIAPKVQPWQRDEAHLLTDVDFCASVVAAGPAFAAVSALRGVVAVGGALDQGGGRASMWASFSSHVGTSMVGVYRQTLHQLDASGFRRIELVTHSKFEQAQRLAIALGFEFEAVLRAWFPPVSALNLPAENGWMFARIR